MKKTFFKRSMASVLSTCLVLTQGVFAAPAVTTLTANAADTNVTIKSFTDIAPDAEKSEWGLNFNTLFKQNAPSFRRKNAARSRLPFLSMRRASQERISLSLSAST